MTDPNPRWLRCACIGLAIGGALLAASGCEQAQADGFRQPTMRRGDTGALCERMTVGGVPCVACVGDEGSGVAVSCDWGTK